MQYGYGKDGYNSVSMYAGKRKRRTWEKSVTSVLKSREIEKPKHRLMDMKPWKLNRNDTDDREIEGSH